MTQTYTKPTLTSDVVAIRFHQGCLQVFLLEDTECAARVQWQLPGCPVEANQDPAVGAQSMLRAHAAGLEQAWLQAGTFTTSANSTHAQSLSVAYLCLTTNPDDIEDETQDHVKGTWHGVTDLPQLSARDRTIIDAGLQVLRRHALTDTFPLLLLPAKFRMRTVRHLYSQILDTTIKPSHLKSWMRKRQAVKRVGPARFERNAELALDFPCPPFTQTTAL